MATQFQDFLMNAATGDLDFSTNSLELVTENNRSLQQRLLMRFSIWQGNWFFDTDLGFPYGSYISNKVVKAIIDAKIKETVRLESDVLAIENFSSTLVNSSRSYSAYLDVITEESETVSIAFISSDEYTYPIGVGGPGRLCDTDGIVESANKLYYLINFQMPYGQSSTWWNTWAD